MSTTTRLFIGSLNFAANEHDIEKLFSAFGEATNIKVVRDDRNKSKGFGFAELPSEAATNAIRDLNGSSFMGRTITVEPTNSKPYELTPNNRARGTKPRRHDKRGPDFPRHKVSYRDIIEAASDAGILTEPAIAQIASILNVSNEDVQECVLSIPARQ
jgi:RNA recognition motif-containing protein